MYNITVNNECIGCGACISTCDLFELVDGKAKHKKGNVKEITCERDAAEVCPVQAIKIEEKKKK